MIVPSKTRRGIFIVIDGIDGAGKSTQVKRLSRWLQELGYKVTASREPTDGPFGRMIRESATTGRLSLTDELNAFLDDRREHVRTLIEPSLEQGHVVIVDRYFYSTVAYQGLRGADRESLLKQMRAEFPIPDITLFFDLPVSEALRRISENRGEVPNEFEQEAALTEIRSSFQSMAEMCKEVRRVDCNTTPDEVAESIRVFVTPLLQLV